MTGVVRQYDCRLYAIYANPDHAHLLVSRSPKIAEETLATIMGESSEKFINQNGLCDREFRWQNSMAAFSISKGHIERVCKYILNQPIHHSKITFKEEYDAFIRYYEHGVRWGKPGEAPY